MKRLLIIVLISSGLTLSFYSIGVFFIGFELLLLPFIIILSLIGLIGIIIIPIGLYRLFKKQNLSKWLVLCIGLSIGFYLGLILQNPIDNWDRNQRNISGQLLIKALENYKSLNGEYPKSLNQLNVSYLNETLPRTYQIERFTYSISQGDYDLDIPIPIYDRWHWNKENKEFEYSDF
jgi:hypothetical protein